jgi:hypothetical protein
MAKLYRPITKARLPKMHKLEREFTDSERKRYHALASMYQGGLETREDREILVKEVPLIAAQLFYHFNDHEIGSLIVERYSEHPESELRRLAHCVSSIIEARISVADSIAKIAGMRVLPEGEMLEELAQQQELPRQQARLHAEYNEEEM